MPLDTPTSSAPASRLLALAGGAVSHALLAPRSALLAASLLLAAGCGGSQAEAGPQDADGAGEPAEVAPGTPEDARIDELVIAYEPVDPTEPSNVQDAAFRNRRLLLDELKGGNRELGRAARRRFDQSVGQPEILRSALLEVAAWCDPEGNAEMLEHMIVTYDVANGLGLRTRAVQILAEVQPERALALLEPLVVQDQRQSTLPPQEALVTGWSTAARKLGSQDTRVLADVATNIFQVPEARYAAIKELGRIGGDLSRKALEEILVEGASDGLLRRKAAQALRAFVPPDELCPILERAAQQEQDQGFLTFLADMLAKTCP